MKRRALLLAVAVASSGCFDFDAQLAEGCARGASWADCRTTPDSGGVVEEEQCAAEPGAACIGLGEWCWENPGPLGIAEVSTVWGRNDSDVYVGGSGALFAHWDGSRWATVPVRIPLDDGAGYEPSVRVVTCRRDGFLLAGDRMGVALQRDAGWVFVGDTVRRFSASTRGEVTALLRDTTANVDFISATAPLRMHTGRVDSERLSTSVLLRDDGPHLAFFRATGSGVLLPDGGQALLTLEANAPLTGEPLPFTTLRGRDLLGFSDGRTLLASDDGWVEGPRLSLPFAAERYAADALADGGVDWWATGVGGRVFHHSQQFGGVEVPVPGGDIARGSWLSPSGNFWVSAGNGRVFRVTPLEVVEELGSPGEPELRDLAVAGDEVVAVGQGTTWWRFDGGWSRFSDPRGHAMRGVALRDGEACMVDAEGRVECLSKAGARSTPYTFVATKPDGGSGVAADGWRSGAVGVNSAGELRVSVGGVLAMEPLVGSPWVEFPLGRGAVTADLLATIDGAWVALDEPDVNGESLRAGQVLFVPLTGTPVSCALPVEAAGGGVYALARTAGGVLAAGFGWAGRCALDGSFTMLTALPGNASFVSIFEDAARTVWLLTNDGRVYQKPFNGLVFTRDRAPSSWSSTWNPRARRIVGSADSLWVGVGNGGVMRRPLP